jgi:hypothetical protein
VLHPDQEGAEPAAAPNITTAALAVEVVMLAAEIAVELAPTVIVPFATSNGLVVSTPKMQ